MSDITMTCGELDERLADWLDGTLDGAERAAVERHLAECARCAGVLAALDERSAAAAALPDLAPTHDLWDGIASRIQPRVLSLGERAAPPARRARRYAAMAVAASALVAATATITVAVMRRGPALAAHDTAAAAPAPNAPAGVANASAHERIIRTYDEEIAGLDSAVRLRRGQLDTATVRIIEKNLKVIDAAILDSRRALEKDPHNRFLNEQLARVLDQKVMLLRTTALLPAKT